MDELVFDSCCSFCGFLSWLKLDSENVFFRKIDGKHIVYAARLRVSTFNSCWEFSMCARKLETQQQIHHSLTMKYFAHRTSRVLKRMHISGICSFTCGTQSEKRETTKNCALATLNKQTHDRVHYMLTNKRNTHVCEQNPPTKYGLYTMYNIFIYLNVVCIRSRKNAYAARMAQNQSP